MKIPPKNIYLNVGFNKSEADLQDVDFSTLSDLSWSEERMSDNDIKYSQVPSEEELEKLYNSLEKGSLVRLLIDKHKRLVNNLDIPVVSQQRELLIAFLEMNNWLSLEDEENAKGVVDCYLKAINCA